MRNKEDILSPGTIQQVSDPSKKVTGLQKKHLTFHVIWSVVENNAEFWHEKESVCQLSGTCAKGVQTPGSET